MRELASEDELLPTDSFCAKAIASVRWSDLQPDSPDMPVVHCRTRGFYYSHKGLVSLYGLPGGRKLPCACQLESGGERHAPGPPSPRDHRTAHIQESASTCTRKKTHGGAV